MENNRRLILILLAAIGILMLVGCARRGHLPGDNPPMMEDIPNQEITDQEIHDEWEEYNYSKE